jgi:AraC-like DNA-binding protein
MVSVDSNEPYERIIIWVNSSFLNKHNLDNNDLLSCFQLAQTQKNNLLRLDTELLMGIKNILAQLENACISLEFGSSILKNSLFIQLIVLINRFFLVKDGNDKEDIEYDEYINSVIDYINKNINCDLSIDSIAAAFYMSKYYLMHKFKKQTGYTIHNYIVKKRLILAKGLLQSGLTVTEVCDECGFEDYSNFLRAFKKMYGLAPKSYYKEVMNRKM